MPPPPGDGAERPGAVWPGPAACASLVPLGRSLGPPPPVPALWPLRPSRLLSGGGEVTGRDPPFCRPGPASSVFFSENGQEADGTGPLPPPSGLSRRALDLAVPKFLADFGFHIRPPPELGVG